MKAKDIFETSSLLSDRVRLLIMVTLASAKNPLDFNYLLKNLELTKGNLSSHIRKLEEGGYLIVNKEFVERKPRTTYSITKEGKKALKNYLNVVEGLLKNIGKG